ncbi:hypothetical protein GCM10020254_82300 [Streptomyces goshikiensis]
MAGGKGRGRAWAPLRAESEEAGELARFLRHLMDLHGVTVRALESGVPYARSTISDNLAGKVPPKQFVEVVVKAVVLEPRKQAVDLRRALDLWQAAQTPSASVVVRPAPGAGTALALADKTSDRLYEVMDRNLELEKDRIGTQQLVLLLMRLVGSLQDQVAALSDVPAAAAELAAVTEQLLAAQKELNWARQARYEAELLASRAQQESVALQEELARLRAAAPSAEEAVPVAAQLPAELQEDFFLADVERALATAEGFLRGGRAVTRAARRRTAGHRAVPAGGGGGGRGTGRDAHRAPAGLPDPGCRPGGGRSNVELRAGHLVLPNRGRRRGLAVGGLGYCSL